jgi:hypothetical protein
MRASTTAADEVMPGSAGFGLGGLSMKESMKDARESRHVLRPGRKSSLHRHLPMLFSRRQSGQPSGPRIRRRVRLTRRALRHRHRSPCSAGTFRYTRRR